MKILFLLFLSALPAFAQQTQWGEVPKEQVAALMEFYESTGGKNWKYNTGWGSNSISPCQWFGVLCGNMDGSESVIRILLNLNGLTGSIPASISKLTHLQSLQIAGNSLTGAVPSSIASLPLQVLDLADNKFTGEMPEEILARWDDHKISFRGNGNSFSNLVVRIRVEVGALPFSLLCSEVEDVHYAFEIRERGAARFESVRCVPKTEFRKTQCLVREGNSWGTLDRLSRALKRLNYSSLQKEYTYLHEYNPNGKSVKTTVWWGDGSSQTVSSFDEQGPIEVWTAQQLLLRLKDKDIKWGKEFYKPTCDEIK
jgi:hypothetical protein